MEVSICSTICSQEETVNLYFVNTADGAPSNILLCAHQACVELFSTQWLSVEECKEVTPTKEDVFICDPFEGEAFEYLVSCPKSIVVGARCILSCLHRKEPIPSLPSPLHNTAMNGLVITTTGFPKARKEELQRLVQRMSGIYSNNFHQDVTHLLVKLVGSEKYKFAMLQGVPAMREEWVSAVWEAVVTGDVSEHVSASDDRFVSYQCQPLHNLVVCVSQVDRPIKVALQKLIEENGGIYTTKLTMGETSVLIVSSPEGRKYHFAVKWGVPCVYPEWVYKSVEKGYALDKEEYEVLPRKSSTFTNSLMTNEMPPDLSMCSTILNDTDTQRTIISVDETVSLEEHVAKRDGPWQEQNGQDVEALESLDLQEAMKAGSFLKGCHVFLAGFTSTHMEKLRRVLGALGASRVSQLTEKATHVVLATPRDEHLKVMQGWSTKPHVVSVRWITECVRLKCPAEEAQFCFPRDLPLPQTSSPVSQVSPMSSGAVDNDETHVDEGLLDEHSLQPGRRESGARRKSSARRESDPDLSMLPESQLSERPGLFHGKTFAVSGHCQETKEELEDMIELYGGCVVQGGSSGPIHYTVMTSEVLHHRLKGQLVSSAFVEDCIESKRLLAVEYYHLPLLLPGNSFPLDECCITFSTYTKYERHFLEHLVTLLGAQNQESFSRSKKANKNTLANTHLLCPTPSGAKYNAAMKWGIPAVTCDWLIECARSGQKVPEEPFLVAASTDTPHLPRKAIIMELWNAAMGTGEMKDVDEEEEEVPATPAVSKIKSVLSTESLAPPSPDRPNLDREAICKMYPIPGSTEFYRAKREAELEATSDSDTPYGTTWYSDPPVKVRKSLKKLITSLPRPCPAMAKPPTESNESPLQELMRDFVETLRRDLKKCNERHQRLLAEVLDQGKTVREKEQKDDGYDGGGDPRLSTRQEAGVEDEGDEGSAPADDSTNQEEHEKQKDEVEVKGDKPLSHQLQEIARASLMGRNGGSGARSKMPSADLQRSTAPKMHHIDLETQPNDEVEPPSTQITWDDPEEHLARLSLQDHMLKETQDFSAPVQKKTEANSSNDDDNNKENIPSRSLQGKPPPRSKAKNKGGTTTTTTTTSTTPTEGPQQLVFLLVGMSREEEKYAEMVAQLGGAVCFSQVLEPQVTHLIANVLSRSERTLMSIVSGRWVLMTSYLDHSLKAGYFIEEEPHAWGNPSAKHHPVLEPESAQAKLAAAAWRWRCASSGAGDGRRQRKPFQDMTALVHSKKDRAKAFSRLIEAGGGQVVSGRPPYSDVESVTHFFVEMEKTHEKVDLASFASRGIPCLHPMYINSCITEDNPDISDYYIPAYKDIISNMSSCIPSPLKRAQRN